MPKRGRTRHEKGEVRASAAFSLSIGKKHVNFFAASDPHLLICDHGFFPKFGSRLRSSLQSMSKFISSS